MLHTSSGWSTSQTPAEELAQAYQEQKASVLHTQDLLSLQDQHLN